MRCSIDLRKRVLAFVHSGGSKAEAARRFGVSVQSVSNWLKADDPMTYQKPGPRRQVRSKHKMDWGALRAHVEAYPDALLKQRAAVFNVSVNSIWYALHQMEKNKRKDRISREDACYAPPPEDQTAEAFCI